MKKLALLVLILTGCSHFNEQHQEPQVECDLNGDGYFTDLLDYEEFVKAFRGELPPSSRAMRLADIDKNGDVTTRDYGYYKDACPLVVDDAR